MQLVDRMTISTPEGVELPVYLAGLGSRFLAILVDLAAMAALVSFASMVAGVVGLATQSLAMVFGVFSLLASLTLFGYFVFWELIAQGRSPGKMAVGLRVVRVGGGRVTFMSAVVRNVLFVFEVLVLPVIAVVACVMSSRNQRLGDMAAGTVVVRERFAPGTMPSVLQPAAYAPDAPFLTWDVSAVSLGEVGLVRRFLERRPSLVPGARWSIGSELARRLRPRVTGVPEGWHDEAFLECLVAAKAIRS